MFFDIHWALVYNNNMINEDRVKIMTKLALEEKKNGPLPVTVGLSKKEYISSFRLFAFVVTSFLYGMLILAIALVLFVNISGFFDKQNILLFLMVTIAIYLILLYIVLRITKELSLRRYRREKKRLKAILEDWEKLEKLYEEQQ